MGKRLIQQRRGRGSIFRALSHRYKGQVKYPAQSEETVTATITSFQKCPAHTAPIGIIKQENGKETIMILPEGIKEKQTINIGKESEIKPGNVNTLENIPEGTLIYNIEITPGDGGKLVRSAGTTAKLIAKTGKNATIILPSKKQKILNIKCRATIGIISGGGRPEKPLMKAGNAYYKKKATRKRYPGIQGISMSAVAHPFGGKKSSTKGRPTIAPHNAPPGRKVGKIRPRRTGKKR